MVKKHNILFVSSANTPFGIGPYVISQGDALKRVGVNITFYGIKGKGLIGYLKNLPKLFKIIKNGNFDIIHSHGGISSFFTSLLSKKTPLVCTFHGTDINNLKSRLLSRIAIWKSSLSIFVSYKLYLKVNLKKKYLILPCGINTDLFKVKDSLQCRKDLGLPLDRKIILFGGRFNNKLKNYSLLEKSKELIDNKDYLILEYFGYNQNQLSSLMNACDILVLTSISEGSPQVIKEALASDLPIVSVDVGSVKEMIEPVSNCYITDYNERQLADKINGLFEKGERSNGSNFIEMYSDSVISEILIKEYKRILTND